MRVWSLLAIGILLAAPALALKVLEPQADRLILKCEDDLDNLTVFIDGEPVKSLNSTPCDNATRRIEIPFTPSGGAYRILAHGYEDGRLAKSERLVQPQGLRERALEFFAAQDSLFVATIILTVLFSLYFFSLRFAGAVGGHRLNLEDEFTGALTHLPPGMPEPPEPEAAEPPTPQTTLRRGPADGGPESLARSAFSFTDPDPKSPPPMGGGFIFDGPQMRPHDPAHADHERAEHVSHRPQEAGRERPHEAASAVTHDRAHETQEEALEALPLDKQMEFDQFVTASLKAGHMLGYIRHALIHGGWPADLVDRELKVYFKSGLFK